jgi:hypothetical protein
MENLIEVFYNKTLYQTYIVEDNDSVIGVIKADCYKEFVLIHPRIYIVNKNSLRKYKDAFKQFINNLNLNLYYDHIYADTNKYNVVKFLTDKKAVCIGKGIEGMLYKHRIL